MIQYSGNREATQSFTASIQNHSGIFSWRVLPSQCGLGTGCLLNSCFGVLKFVPLCSGFRFAFRNPFAAASYFVIGFDIFVYGIALVPMLSSFAALDR